MSTKERGVVNGSAAGANGADSNPALSEADKLLIELGVPTLAEYRGAYRTLGRLRDELLKSARGQYILIHDESSEVVASLDDGVRRSWSLPSEAFLLLKISEIDIDEYLAVIQ